MQETVNGLIYKAVQQFVLDNHSVDTWDQVVAKAHLTSTAETAFQRVNGSALTHLVEIVAELIEQPLDTMLESAGRHWVLRNAEQVGERLTRTNRASYGMGAVRDVPQFQTGIGMIFPALKPPVLHCRVESPTRGIFDYPLTSSHFTPFVLGLLSGVALCFDERLKIELKGVDTHTDALAHAEFLATIPSAA